MDGQRTDMLESVIGASRRCGTTPLPALWMCEHTDGWHHVQSKKEG